MNSISVSQLSLKSDPSLKLLPVLAVNDTQLDMLTTRVNQPYFRSPFYFFFIPLLISQVEDSSGNGIVGKYPLEL